MGILTSTAAEGAGSGSVGASSAQLVAANTSRSYFMVENTHATQDLYLAFGETAVASKGIKLAAGQTWEMPDHAIWTGAINCIGSGAATTYVYVEWS